MIETIDGTVWCLAVLVVTVVTLIVVWLRTGQPASAADALNRLEDAQQMAIVLVQAAEQLTYAGTLPADDRLDYVIERLAPYVGDWLNPQQVRALVESAVYVVNLGASRGSAG